MGLLFFTSEDPAVGRNIAAESIGTMILSHTNGAGRVRFVEGTVVRVRADIFDHDGSPYSGEVTATIGAPDGTIDVRTLSGGDVWQDSDLSYRFVTDVDTTDLPGDWRYQFASSGGEAVVGKATFRIRVAVEAMV